MRRPIIILYCFLLVTVLFQSCFRTNTEGQTPSDYNSVSDNKFSKQNFNLQRIEDLYTFFTYNEESYPLVSAHRGGPQAGYPENAIETFALHAKKFPLVIECDVRMTKDSILVLMHDETLNRTSTGKGKVNHHDLATIKKLRLKDNNGKETPYKIPTLEEALIWGKGKVIYNLDVKNDVPYVLLNEVISRANAEAYSIVITYNAAQARALYRTNPELMLSVNIKSDKDWSKLIGYDIPDNRLVAFVGSSQPKEALTELLHNHGVKIILGAHGNLDRQAKARGYQIYAEFIEEGVDIISTDQPVEAQKALDFYIRKRNITSPFVNN